MTREHTLVSLRRVRLYALRSSTFAFALWLLTCSSPVLSLPSPYCRDCFLPTAWSEENSQAYIDVVGRRPRNINLGCPQTAVLERKQQIRAQVVDTVDEGALVPTERGVNIALALRKAPQVRSEGVVLAERSIEFQSLRRLEFELCPSSGRIKSQHRASRI